MSTRCRRVGEIETLVSIVCHNWLISTVPSSDAPSGPILPFARLTKTTRRLVSRSLKGVALAIPVDISWVAEASVSAFCGLLLVYGLEPFAGYCFALLADWSSKGEQTRAQRARIDELFKSPPLVGRVALIVTKRCADSRAARVTKAAAVISQVYELKVLHKEAHASLVRQGRPHDDFVRLKKGLREANAFAARNELTRAIEAILFTAYVELRLDGCFEAWRTYSKQQRQRKRRWWRRH